jgi:S1-C subfamily serine protease
MNKTFGTVFVVVSVKENPIMNKKTLFFGLVFIAVSVILSLTSASIYAKVTKNQPISDHTLAPTSRLNPVAAFPSFEDAAEHSVNAVVHVKSDFLVRTQFFDDYFGFFNPHHGRVHTQRAEGFGSGVVISADGYIITNNHVVQDAETIEITLNNRRTFPARVVGTDPSTDLALLKIEANNLEFLRFGNSDHVRIGQWVLAVGNPFNLNSTVTAGIVSARARNMNILSQNMRNTRGGRPIESFIQTDAAVNRGNSGGALVNLNAELIGINTAIASTSGEFAGYSFAVPANIARKVSEDLRMFGEVQRAFFGILFNQVDQTIAAANQTENFDGLHLAMVTETGASYKAGIRVGDVLLKINGSPVNTEGEYFEIAGTFRPGETVELTYMRKGRISTTNVVLQDIDGGTAKRVVKQW